MKQASALIAVVLSLGLTLAPDAWAKRLGGARSSGMQRQQATQPAHTNPSPAAAPSPATAQSPAATATAAPAAPAAKRGWAGALTGVAAGLGLVALASYLGFGEALANAALVMLAVVAVLAIAGWAMRRRAAATMTRLAPAFGDAGRFSAGPARGSGADLGHPAAMTPPASVAPGFDAAAFSRIAKAQFVALQEANDARDLQRLRNCFTPEMFEAVREEVQARGDQLQRTEVFGLDAQVLEAVEEPERHVVSVRFTGSVREQPGAVPEDLDEIWHLTRPRRGDGDWQVAGIQQVSKAG
jgi:predicted lipid-binding transport protein (Tim44 family)